MGFRRDGSSAAPLHFDTGTNDGQYAIGTFVASSSSQTLRLWGNESGQINAIQVRNLGVIPEPASLVMGLMGLSLIVGRRRRTDRS
jgi:MYXO-CTERM domain-containing protein